MEMCPGYAGAAAAEALAVELALRHWHICNETSENTAGIQDAFSSLRDPAAVTFIIIVSEIEINY